MKRPVYCQNALCGYALHRGKPRLVLYLDGKADLPCPACRVVQSFDTTTSDGTWLTPPARVRTVQHI